MMKKRVALMIGRFQPPHLGHFHCFHQALETCEELIILVGSSHGSLDPKNPFSFKKRQEMIAAYTNKHLPKRVAAIFPLKDHLKDVHWSQSVRQTVNAVAPDAEIVLCGFHKDSSSYYLNYFPDWEFQELPNYKDMSATDIRNSLFELNNIGKGMVPDEVSEILKDWTQSEEFSRLKKEYLFYKSYKEKFAGMEHKPTFVTVDAVIFDNKQNVLLIKRKDFPGKGYYSLPGGFVGQEETLAQSVIRTVEEKTGLILSEDDIRRVKVIDNPGRSLRGRTITHVHAFQLGSQIPCRGEWMNVNQLFLYEEQIFEDHKRIIEFFAE